MKNYEVNIKKILEVLLRSSQFVTLESLSNDVGISRRSVQNYIDKIMDWIWENALTQTHIEKKRGYGVRLNTTPAERNQIKRLLDFKHLNIHSGDAKRRLDILKLLMFSEDEITIQLLSSQFYVSRATILSDLDWTGQWLSQYKLKLYKTQHRGIGIIGDEVAHRNAIAGFFDTYELGVLSDFDTPEPLGRFDEKSIQNLIEIYPRDTVLKVAKIIEDAEREFEFILLDDFFMALLTHMVISILRISDGNSVSKEFLPPEEKFPPLETKTAEFIAMRVRKVLGISLSQAEQAYICIHLVGYNAFTGEQDSGFLFPQKIEHLAVSLIELVDSKLSTYYSHDKMLFLGLCLHLKTAVYRLKITTYTPSTHRVALPNSLPNIHDALKEAPALYEQICQVVPDEGELLSIACYFMLSHHRYSNPIRVLLVSNLGIISRIDLLNEIENAFPNIKIVDSCSVQQLSDWPNRRFSLIISTEHLENCTRPCIVLPPTTKSSRYLSTIEDFLNQMLPDLLQ